jgi:hypothetical protein
MINKCKQAAAIFLLSFLPYTSHANSDFLNHAQYAFQTMSAMYMKVLSEGGDKYQGDLDKYKKLATISMNAYQLKHPNTNNDFSVRWEKLKDKLTVDYSSEYDWTVNLRSRNDARDYMFDLYLNIMNNKELDNTRFKPLLAQVQMQAIIARFFDVSSTSMGAISLSEKHLSQLDPKIASKQFKSKLDALMLSLQNKKLKKDILSIKTKWGFIEKNVVDYSHQSAYFLVYATKNRIFKTLTSVSQVTLNK